MAASANYEFCAAVILAKVSGNDVPTATSVIAVTAGFKPTVHPRTVATSATTAVIPPMNDRATKNAGQPPPHSVGGIQANNIFQPIFIKWNIASLSVTGMTLSSSSTAGASCTAYLN